MSSEGSACQDWGPFFSESAEPCLVVKLERGAYAVAAVNPAWEHATRPPDVAAHERSSRAYSAAEVVTAVEQYLTECLREGKAVERDQELTLPAGPRLWRTRYRPWPRGDAPTHVLCISRDVTDEVHAARALNDSEARFRRLAENAHDVIYRIRYQPELRVDYVNHAISGLTGYPAEAFYGDINLWVRLVHPDDRERLAQYVRAPTSDLMPMRCIDRSGRWHWLEARNVCIHDERGQLLAIEGIARDVTHRKQREQERSNMERKLLEMQKLESLGVLAGGVAHDFNNLLTGILGRVTLMKSGVSDESAREHVEQIEHAAVQAADLCRQMLAYSGKGHFLLARLDINELVRETLPLLQQSLGKNARLELRLDEQLPALSGDAAQFRQLLLNLVANAGEALIDGCGTVTVSTSSLHVAAKAVENGAHIPDLPPGRYVSLIISDTGSGMSSETRKRMFEPFYSTKFTGRGLGLPAVLGIVRGHRGVIDVDSRLGSGTSMKLAFPAASGGSDRAPSAARKGKGYRGTGTILIIDDEEVVRSVTTRILQSVGFNVIAAADGIDGLARFRSHTSEVSAVLLDLTMPGLDGEAVFRELRALREDVPVLLMSGYNEQDAMARFAGKGLAGFLQKPFTMDQLLEKLRSVLPPATA